MKYFKKAFIAIIVSMLFMSIYAEDIPNYSDSFMEDLKTINSEMISLYNQDEDYYELKNVNGKYLNEDIYDGYSLLVYGTPQELRGNSKRGGEYRYLGEDIRGQYVPNDLFSDDNKSGLDFAVFNWYEYPSRQSDVIKSRLLPNIWLQFDISDLSDGKELIHSYLSTLSDMYKGRYMKDIASVDWKRYLHVVALPTSLSKGLVVTFHKTSRGNVYYKDVRTKKLGEIGSKVIITHRLIDGSAPEELKSLDSEDYLLNKKSIRLQAPNIESFEYSGYGLEESFGEVDVKQSSESNTIDYTLEYSFEKNTINIRFFYKQIDEEDIEEDESTPLTGRIIISSDEFDVSKWIPVDENVNIRAEVDQGVILKYSYSQKSEDVEYEFTINYLYKDKKGIDRRRTRHRTFTQTLNYYVIDSLELYMPEEVYVSNKSLKRNGLVKLTLEDLEGSLPDFDIVQHEDHVLGDLKRKISISYHEGERYNIDAYMDSEARNDKISIGSDVLMSDEYSMIPPIPSKAYGVYPMVFEQEYLIPKDIENSNNKTKGLIKYKLMKSVGQLVEAEETEEDTTNGWANSVEISGNDVHQYTPVAINAVLEFDTKYDQRADENPSKAELVAFPINTVGSVDLNMIREDGLDTRRFAERRVLDVPFDVYMSSDRAELEMKNPPKETYFRKGEVLIPEDLTHLYIRAANWSHEGEMDIKLKAYAKNHEAYVRKLEGLGENRDEKQCIAYRSNLVDIVGRVYGFTVVGSKDPKWKSFFKSSSIFSGNFDMNGKQKIMKDSNVLFPLVKGKNTKEGHSNVPLSLGYAVELGVKTMGDYRYTNEFIRLIPSYYVIDKKTKERFPVDLYYRYSKGYIKYDSPDAVFVYGDKFLNRDSSIKLSRYLLTRGIYERSSFDTPKESKKFRFEDYASYVHSYYKMSNLERARMLARARYFRGDIEMGFNETKKIKIDGYDEEQHDLIMTGAQKWMTWFMVPSNTVALRKSEDGNLNFIQGKTKFIDEGLLVVKFEVQVHKWTEFGKKQTVPRLVYENSNQNMWKNQGYPSEEFDGIKYEVGDVLVYDLSRRATDNVRIGK